MRQGRHRILAALALPFIITLAAQSPDRSIGATIFARDCATCHDGAEGSRAPKLEVLRQRSPEAILAALTAGGMRPQGARLTGAERRAVAEFVSGKAPGGDITGASIGRCAADAPAFTVRSGQPSWPSWSPSLANTRLQTTTNAGLTAADVSKLSLKWAFGFPDATSAWSQPTVAGNWLFVGSQNGTVYALDAKSGCIHWTFTARSGVRTALTIGAPDAAGRVALYFGDTGANVYAVDAATGRERWSREMDAHQADHRLADVLRRPRLRPGGVDRGDGRQSAGL